MNEREITLEDILALQEEPQNIEAEQPAVSRAPAGTDPNRQGAWRFAKTAARQDWAPYAMARWAAQDGIELDENFQLGRDLPEAEWNELTDGLDDDAKEKIAGAARSRSHAYFLADLVRESNQREAELASYGGWGMAGRMGVGVVDPTNVLLAMGTGGVGVADKARRIATTAKTATTLVERRAAVAALGEIAAKNPGMTNALKAGGLAAAENAALESVIVAGSPDRDGYDVALAATAGLVLGTGVSKALSRGEMNVVRRSHSQLKAKLGVDELAEQVNARRAEITARLGNVNSARTEVASAQRGAAVYLSERDGDLGSYGDFRRILESGGRADAKAPTSSATGIDQFTEGTWLGMVAKEKPAWAKGLTREQLLEARKDVSKSSEMVAALDRDNTAALRKANAPVNHFTLYATHHFGPNKGVRFALADGETKMEDILTAAQLNANKYLKGKTKAEALAIWTGRAKKGGWAMEDIANVTSASRAERASFEAAQKADSAAAASRLVDTEARLSKAMPEELDVLTRQADMLRRSLGGDEVAKIEDRILDLELSYSRQLEELHADDLSKLGPELANTATRSKVRESIIDKRISVERDELESALARVQEGIPKDATATPAGRAIAALKSGGGTAKLDDDTIKLREALGLGAETRKAKEAAAARRRDTSDLLRALQGKSKDLDTLDDLDTVGSANELRAVELKERGGARAFGPDTLSAARAIGFDAGLHPSLEGTAGNAPVDKMKFADAVKLFGRGTFAGVLRGSDSEVVRTELGVLVGNSLGNVGDTVNSVGASEIANMFQRTMAGRFNAAAAPAYDAWLKEQGISKFFAYSRGNRERFMRAVGLAVRGQEGSSPHVNALARAARGVFADVLREAKVAGVKGFDNVDTNDNYLPRVFDFHALHTLNAKVGPDELGRLIQKGIQQNYPELEDKIAAKIGNAYITRMRELRVGSDAGMMQGMSFDDIGFLREFLGDAKLGSDEIEEIVGKFAALKTPESGTKLNQEGNFRHAKMRQKFDENFSLDLRLKQANDGSTIKVRISDLFENNVETLFGRYSRTMSGHIGLAKVGIKSRADFSARMQRVERALENAPDELSSVKRMGQAAYDLIASKPLEDSGLFADLGRTGRDIAYAAQMENVGLSNIPDLASLLAWGNFKLSARTFFGGDVFGAMWKRGEDGRLLNAEWREIEETMGIGTDYLSNQVFSSYDIAEEYAEELAGGNAFAKAASAGFAKVGHAARVTSRIVTAGSGLAPLTAMAQRMAARNVIYRIKDDVLRGTGFSKARAASLGLDDAMKDRIAVQIRSHAGSVESEYGKAETSNFHLWDDHDARDAFLYAVHRETKKNVQEEDLGDTTLFMNKSIGKVLTQFRRFGLTAWTKQTLRGIAEHDAETATRVLMQFVLAAGVWQLRNELILAGMEASGTGSEKIEKFRREKLAPDRIAAAGLRNSGFMALLPDAYDTAAGFALDSPFFNVRNSGLDSNLLSGVPLVSLVGTMGQAASGTMQAIVRGDRQFDRRDLKAWQALVPFGNHLLVAPAIDAIGAHLPERDEDDDKEEIQWFM